MHALHVLPVDVLHVLRVLLPGEFHSPRSNTCNARNTVTCTSNTCNPLKTGRASEMAAARARDRDSAAGVPPLVPGGVGI